MLSSQQVVVTTYAGNGVLRSISKGPNWLIGTGRSHKDREGRPHSVPQVFDLTPDL